MRAKPHRRSPGRLRRAAKLKHRVARKRNNSHLMPPRRSSKKDSPKKLAGRMKRRWRVVLLRAKGEILGEVEAPDVASAKAAAVVQFELDDIQRNRIVVQELGPETGRCRGVELGRRERTISTALTGWGSSMRCGIGVLLLAMLGATAALAQTQNVPPPPPVILLPQTSIANTCTLGCDSTAMFCLNSCVAPATATAPANQQCSLSCTTSQLVCKQRC
jgi:hypothetical protein